MKFTYEMSSERAVFLGTEGPRFASKNYSMSKHTSKLEERSNRHIFLCVIPSAWKMFFFFNLLKERHCACYQRTQSKRDSSQTKVISNPAYSNVVTHKSLSQQNTGQILIMKYRFEIQTKGKNILLFVTTYNSGVLKLKEILRRTDRHQPEPCTNLSECPHCHLLEEHVAQRPLWSELRSLLSKTLGFSDIHVFTRILKTVTVLR